MQQTSESSSKGLIDLARIRAAIAPVLAAHGVDLVDVEWLTERAGWTLRITIERVAATPQAGPAGAAGWGVTLDDCANVSRDVSSVLDVEDLVPTQHNLEVSSPGLDRRLRTPAELARFAGSTVKVKLARPAPDGQRVLRGELVEAQEGRAAIVVDGKRIEVPFDDVTEARLVFELAPQPKRPKQTAARRGSERRK